MVLIAIAITVSTFLTWHFSASTGTEAVETAGNRFRSSLLAHALEHVETSLVHQSNGTGVLADILSSTLVSEPLLDSDGFLLEARTAIWLLFRNDGGLSSLRFATKAGQTIGYIRYANGTIKFAYSNDTSQAENVVVFSQDVDLVSGEPTGSPMAVMGPNTHESQAYIRALQKAEGDANDGSSGIEAAAWEVAVGQQGSAVMRCGLAVRNASTTLVTGVALSSTVLSRGFDVSQDVVAGTLYFVDKNWTLLGSSNNLAEPTGFSAFASPRDVIRQTAQLVYAAGGFADRWPVTMGSTSGLVDLGDSSIYYINSGLLDLGGLQLLGILAVPRCTIMGGIGANNRRMVILLAVVAPVGLFLSCVFVVLFTMRVNSEMILRDEVIRQLQHAQRAEAASEYKTKFLCQMSHDLRTPLACIVGLLDMLMNDGSRDPELLRSLGEVRHCALQLLDLFNSVLDLSKLEAGRLSLDIHTFDLRHELELLSDLFAVPCSRKRISLAVDLHDDLPQIVLGDCGRFRQIQANLLANAVKATTSGCVVLRARPATDADGPILDSSSSMGIYGSPRSSMADDELQPAGRGWMSWLRSITRSPRSRSAWERHSHRRGRVRLIFEVEDSGLGIQAEIRAAMFSPFSQEMLKKKGGDDLGLSIVSSLVSLMDGHIGFVRKDTERALVRFDLMFDTVAGQPAASSHIVGPTSTPESGTESRSAAGCQLRACASRTHSFILAERSRLLSRVQVSSDHKPPASVAPTGLPGDRSGVETRCKRRSRQLSPGCCIGMQAVVATADDVSRAITAAWLRRRGFWTEEVKTWGELQALLPRVATEHSRQLGTCQDSRDLEICAGVGPCENGAQGRPVLLLLDVALAPGSLISAASVVAALEALRVPAPDLTGSSSGGTSRQTPRDAGRWRRSDVAVAWLVDSSASVGWRRGLREEGYGLVVSMPLHPSRLTTLLMAILHPGASIQSSGGGQSAGRTDTGAKWEETGLEVPLLRREQEEQLMLWSSKGPASPGELSEWHTSGSEGSLSPSGLRDCKETRGLYELGEGQAGMGQGEAIEKCERRHEGGTRVGQGGGHAGHSEQDQGRAGGRPGGAHQNQRAQGERQAAVCQEDLFTVVDVREPEVAANDGPSVGQGGQAQAAAAALGPTQCRTTQAPQTEVPNTSSIIAHSASRWPLTQRHPEATADPAASLGKSKELAGLNILVVEDTVVLRRVAKAALVKMGAEVFEVQNGRQAVDAVMVSLRHGNGCTLPEPAGDAVEGEEPCWVVAARSHVKAHGPFAVVIMDCQMPVMDGYEATQAIRKLNDSKGIASQLPIVALTAHAMTSDEESCLAIGMSAYLTKPLNTSRFVATVARLLQG